MALRHAKFRIYGCAGDGAVTAIHAVETTEEQVHAITAKSQTVGDGTFDIHKNGVTILKAPVAFTGGINKVYKGASLRDILAAHPTPFAGGVPLEIIIAGTTNVNSGVTVRNIITSDRDI